MRKILVLASVLAIPGFLYAQSAFDAYRLSQPDLKGTARFMGMAGAFTALGGDLSTLSQNPGGIGVYRNSDIGFTLDLDCQNSSSSVPGLNNKETVDQTKFLLNNIGFVWTVKLPSSTCPNINFGFTYNKSTSFNRRYAGWMPLNGSLSNLIAANASSMGYSESQLYGDNPYFPDKGYGADWLSILGYNSYLISAKPGAVNQYIGQWGQTTSGTGYFDVLESGSVDSYNIALGGNIKNTFYWGMDFDITHMNYNLNPIWEEDLNDAYIENGDHQIQKMKANWDLYNLYNCSGTGFNFKLGFIVKPIQELRLGFSFATPTWYNLTETYLAGVDYSYDGSKWFNEETNGGVPAYDSFNLRTPWKINAGIAGVLFNRLIVSADYEWNNYGAMKYSAASPSYYDPWTDNPWYDPYDPWWYSASPDTRAGYIENNPYYETNQDISNYYKSSNTIRIGAEFRITNRFSVRAGYSYISSPVKNVVKDGKEMVVTAGTMPNYRVDNSTNYVTAGLGYNIGHFYVDAAYVYKHMDSDFHAYSPDPADFITSPTSKLSLNNSQVVLSAGFKF